MQAGPLLQRLSSFTSLTLLFKRPKIADCRIGGGGDRSRPIEFIHGQEVGDIGAAMSEGLFRPNLLTWYRSHPSEKREPRCSCSSIERTHNAQRSHRRYSPFESRRDCAWHRATR